MMHLRPTVKNITVPKWFRVKLAPAEQVRCKFAHINLIERFTNGSATKQDMLDWICNALTYARMVQLLADDGQELSACDQQVFAEQVLVIDALVDRYRLHGRVGFSGPELEIARTAAGLMDQVIELDRHGIAAAAGAWAVAQMQRIQLGPKP